MHRGFLHFLKYVTTDTPPALLMVSAFPCGGSILELAGTSCVWCGGSCYLFLQRPTLQSPTTKILPHKPKTPLHHNRLSPVCLSNSGSSIIPATGVRRALMVSPTVVNGGDLAQSHHPARRAT